MNDQIQKTPSDLETLARAKLKLSKQGSNENDMGLLGGGGYGVRP